MMKPRMLKVAYLIPTLLLFFTSITNAATRTASTTGNWSATATWGGSPVPNSSDAVIINEGVTVTVNIPNAQCASLAFINFMNPSSTLTISGTNALTITGNLRMYRPRNGDLCTVNVNAGSLSCGSLTMSATTVGRNNTINITTGTLTVSGDVTTGTTGCILNLTGIGGTMNISGTTSGTPTISTVNGSRFNYTGSGLQTIFPTTYNGTLAFSGTGTKSIANATTVNGTLNLSNGVLDNSTNLTIANGTTITRSQGSISSVPTFAGTVNLVYSGASSITTQHEMPTSAVVLNNLTTNSGGVIQGGTDVPASTLLSDNFGSLTGWTGDIGSGGNQFRAMASSNAGGSSKECRYARGTVTTTNYTASMYKSVTTTGFTALNISWKQFIDNSDAATYPYTIKIQCATTTSGPWTDIYSVTPSGTTDIGPETQTHNNWTTNVGGTFYVRYYITGYTYGLTYWYFDDLLIEGVATTLPSTTSVNGTLDVTNGTYSIATNVLTLNGAMSGSNSLVGSSTSDLIVGGVGSNLSIPSLTGGLKNLTINRPNGATLNNPVNMARDLTIGLGASLQTGAYSHSIGRNFTNDGTFDGTGSTFTFNGDTAQNIAGTSATTFNNLIIDSDTVKISNSALTTVSGNLTINNTKRLELSAGKKLTVEGLLTNNAGTAGLVIRSTAAGTGSLIHNTPGVSATVERYIVKNSWHITSALVAGQDIPAFLTNASNNIPTSGINYGMMRYSESTSGWAYFTTSTTGNLTVGNGYLLRHTTDAAVSMYGTLTSASTNVNVVQASNGWNCIGNPFPSSIGVREDASTDDNFLTFNADAFDPSYAVLYLWDEPLVRVPGVNYYKVIGNSGFTSSKPVLDQAYLQPGQGFLMKAKTGGSTVSFTQNMRVHEVTASYFKAGRAPWSGINLVVNSGSKSASTAITFHENMTRGLDVTYDAGLLGGDPAFKLYSRLVEDNGVNFMLQCLPNFDFDTICIPLGIVSNAGGQVSFAAELTSFPSAYRTILEDRLLGTFTDLTEATSSYAVNLAPNTSGTGRFFLYTIVDNIAPSIPANLTSSDITGNAFTLSWEESTDNIGVTAYEVFKDEISIGTTSDLSMYITGLTSATTYAMTVKARDAAANWSETGTSLDVTTLDTIAPIVPTGLVISAKTGNSFTLSWDASTDNVGVSGYEVFKDDISIGTTSDLSMYITGLTSATTYAMTVKARDAAANWSEAGTALDATTLDTIAPGIPTGLASSDITGNTFTLSWNASTDNVGTTGYEVFKDDISIGITSAVSMSITGLTSATTYAMTVKARDAAANWSEAGTAMDVTTLDTIAPSVPTGLASSLVTENSFTLTWDASSDNVGVTNYEVFKGAIYLGTTTELSMGITGLSCETTYEMTVKVRDAAENWSDASMELPVTTLACSDSVTGINSNLENTISVYPNPVTTELIFKNIPTNASITATTIDGKLVSKINAIGQTVEFNVSRWNKGIYLFQIQASTGVLIKMITVE